MLPRSDTGKVHGHGFADGIVERERDEWAGGARKKA